MSGLGSALACRELASGCVWLRVLACGARGFGVSQDMRMCDADASPGGSKTLCCAQPAWRVGVRGCECAGADRKIRQCTRLRNQIQEDALLVQIVLTLCFRGLDFGVDACVRQQDDMLPSAPTASSLTLTAAWCYGMCGTELVYAAIGCA
eukprot:506374-Rhodomonas_salina.1